MKPSAIAGSLALMTLCGCATLTEDTRQTVRIETPGVSDAQCTLSQRDAETQSVSTPAEVSVHRRRYDLTVECRKAGYGVASITIPSVVAASAKYELPLGYMVDAFTGAMFRYPEIISVEMNALPQGDIATSAAPVTSTCESAPLLSC